jgi:drug/metabolite transporter (DMT)-like permease
MENLWVILALISAFGGATLDALTKKTLQNHNEYLIAWLRILFPVPLLLTCLLFIPVPALDREFFLAILTALPFEVAAYILYIKAIRTSPLSLTVPFLSLTPISLLIIPYLVLGERISFGGGTGILLIALGGYTLNLKELKKGFFEPFMAIGRNKGSLYMILAALIYGITNTYGKQAIEHSSPLFFGVIYNIVFSIAFTPIALNKCRLSLKEFSEKGLLKYAIWFGILVPITVLFYTAAMGLAKVAYMVAVNRLSLLISIIYGRFLFGESGFRERLLGTLIMLAGFTMIIFFQ